MIRILSLVIALGLSLNVDSPADPANSVFQVIVTTPDGGVRKGSAFVFHLDGHPDHPTFAYLLTAAHVILGDLAKDGTPVKDSTPVADVAKSVSVRFGPAQGDLWSLQLESIRIPLDWKSAGRDFAVLRVDITGRQFEPLPLTFDSPQPQTSFNAYGFPGDFTIPYPYGGQTQGIAGANNPYLWIVAAGTIPQGLSGGPALLTSGEAFAIVEGWPSSAPELRYLAPLTLIGSWLQDNVPHFVSPTVANRFQLRASVVSRALVTTTQEPFEKRNQSVNVGCEESRTDTISYLVAPGTTLVDGSARWDQVDNIKSQQMSKALFNGSELVATGTIVGLDKNLGGLNCPGGGHATLVLSGVVSRKSTTLNNTVVDVGSSELGESAVTFSLPQGIEIRALRVDIRPLGSTGAFSSINVNINPTSTTVLEQVFFGKRFRVSADSSSLKIERIS